MICHCSLTFAGPPTVVDVNLNVRSMGPISEQEMVRVSSIRNARVTQNATTTPAFVPNVRLWWQMFSGYMYKTSQLCVGHLVDSTTDDDLGFRQDKFLSHITYSLQSARSVHEFVRSRCLLKPIEKCLYQNCQHSSITHKKSSPHLASCFRPRNEVQMRFPFFLCPPLQAGKEENRRG